MTPDKMRQCMSLGYSAKSKMANTIGQCELLNYFKKITLINLMCKQSFPFCFFPSNFLPDGNGFKTSTMRLGADVIVFSRCQGNDGKR